MRILADIAGWKRPGFRYSSGSLRNSAASCSKARPAARFPVEIEVDAGEKRLFRARSDPVGVVFAGIDEERLSGLLEKRLSRFRQQQLEIAPDRQNQFMVRQPASGPLCGGRNREIRVMDGRFDFFQLHKRLLSDI